MAAQVAGGGGENVKTGGSALTRGSAQGIQEQPARDGVEASGPYEGGRPLRGLRAAGDLDGAAQVLAGNLIPDP